MDGCRMGSEEGRGSTTSGGTTHIHVPNPQAGPEASTKPHLCTGPKRNCSPQPLPPLPRVETQNCAVRSTIQSTLTALSYLLAFICSICIQTLTGPHNTVKAKTPCLV